MRIQHNIPAMNALTHYTNNNNALAGNLEKLSSGYKINSAADDAAGLAISEKMRSQIAGLEKAYDNTNDGISLVQTAEGALTEVNSMLTRLKTLATQSANGTYQEEVDREAIQQETNDILDEIDRISQSTNFNGINLLDGSLSDSDGTAGKTVSFDGSVVGLNSEMSAATKNSYKTTKFTLGVTPADGDVFTFNVTYTDNKGVDQVKSLSYTVKDNANKIITDQDGNDITLSAAISSTTLASQFIKDLAADKDFAANFKVEEGNTTADGTIQFTAVDKGTTGAALKGFSVTELDESAGNKAVTGTSATLANSSLGVDSKKTYDLSSVKVWDGEEDTLEASIFEIDGQKFVFTSLTANSSGTAGTLTAEKEALLNKAGVGSNYVSDVTAVGATDVEKMAHQIETATGLKVTQGKIDTGNNDIWAADATATSIIIEKVAKGSAPLVLQVGDTNDDFQKVSVSINDMSSKGIGIAGLDLSSQDAAGESIDIIKAAVNTVSAQRGKLGALQNRLDHTLNNLDAMTENITSSEAQIRDTNMAKEMTAYTKNNILAQAAQSMLAQANSMPQGVLQLLQ